MKHTTPKTSRGGVAVSPKKSFLTSLGTSFAKGATFSLGLLITGAIIVYAISYPATPPAGEVAGGKFMGYFNKMLVDTNLATTDGTVKNADKVDGLHASEIGGGGLSAAGAGVKPFFISVSAGTSCPIGWTKLITSRNSGNNIHYIISSDGGFITSEQSNSWDSQVGTKGYITTTLGTTSNEFCIIFY